MAQDQLLNSCGVRPRIVFEARKIGGPQETRADLVSVRIIFYERNVFCAHKIE